MDVWVLEWSYPYDGENNITIWANKQDAQKQALNEINDLITNDWDLEDEFAASCADDIEDMIRRGHYEDAIKRFNDFQDEHNPDHCQYWHVREYEVLTGDSEAPTLPPPAPVGYRAPYPGATCRGPCGNFNDYAHADQRDGTYVCRQCSTFQHIFGTKAP